VRLMDKAVFVRELLPQDLKIEIEQLTRDEAMKVAHFLSAVVGKAHSRFQNQKAMAKGTSAKSVNVLRRADVAVDDIVELLANHERAYLEHCRKYDLEVNG
jgi:uncharacterized protein (DUF2252 family)